MNGAGIFFLLLLLLVILPALAWFLYVRYTAHKNGLPAPPLSAYNPFNNQHRSGLPYPIAPRRGGVVGWVQDKYQNLKQNRSFGGGGAGLGGNAGAAGGGRGQFRSLDPDGAWDDRVGAEADYMGVGGAGYEEQELGLHPGGGAYGGGGYGEHGSVLPEYGAEASHQERGRSRSRGPAFEDIGGGQRGLDARYDEEMHRGRASDHNPFGDEAEASSLRGVSPRPVEMDAEGAAAGQGHRGKQGSGDGHSVKSERKSVFQESIND